MKEYRIREYNGISTIEVIKEIKVFGWVIHKYWVDYLFPPNEECLHKHSKLFFNVYDAYEELKDIIEEEPIYYYLRQGVLSEQINKRPNTSSSFKYFTNSEKQQNYN